MGASGNLASDGDTSDDTVRYPAAFDKVIAISDTDYSLDLTDR